MQRIVAGGTGFIGQRLVQEWLSAGHTVAVVGRSKEKIERLFQNRVHAIEWNHLSLDHLKNAEIIVNLAGESIAEKRWTENRKKEIVQSRVDTTKKIATLLASLGKDSPPLFNASAASIYGLQDSFSGLPPRFDGAVSIDWDVSSSFLTLVAKQWEQAAKPAVQSGVRVIFMRFSVVLGKKGGALPRMVQPFYFYLGGPIGHGEQPFSWIALHDVIRAIQFLYDNPAVSGPIDMASPNCVSQREFAETVGKVLHRPARFPMPAILLHLLFGQMANELLLHGQHVYPKRLLEMGFQFTHPELEGALRAIFNRNS